MSLIYCPECGHEISTAAVACPSCGRPINARPPVIDRNVVVADVPRREEGTPKWVVIPVAILGTVLLFVMFILFTRTESDSNSNLSVNVSARRTPVSDLSTSSTVTSTIPGPPVSDIATDTQTTNVPGSQTTMPPPAPIKGKVLIDAKVATRSGVPQAVRNEKFYLLDKDLESILDDAGLEPIEGQSLSNSFGLSVLYPDRFGSFNRDAMQAIKEHIKYVGQTDGSGKAQLGGVEPNSYYLFGIAKAGKGFAIWSSPVSVIAGDNVMNLSPQQITEMAGD